MEGWIERPEASRSINAFSVEFVVRYMREAANLFDNDYDRAIIFLSILQANGRQNIREPFFREEDADVRKSLPSELARPVSRLGLAESLGMSRETVRRKVAALIKDAYLQEVDDASAQLHAAAHLLVFDLAPAAMFSLWGGLGRRLPYRARNSASAFVPSASAASFFWQRYEPRYAPRRLRCPGAYRLFGPVPGVVLPAPRRCWCPSQSSVRRDRWACRPHHR